MQPTCSYVFCMVYLPEWNDELQKSSEDIQNKYKIFLNPHIHHIREEEYLDSGLNISHTNTNQNNQ